MSDKLDTLPSDLRIIAGRLVADKFNLPREGEVVDKVPEPAVQPEIPYHLRNNHMQGTPMYQKDYGRLGWDVRCSFCSTPLEFVPATALMPVQASQYSSTTGYGSTTPSGNWVINRACMACGGRMVATTYLS